MLSPLLCMSGALARAHIYATILFASGCVARQADSGIPLTPRVAFFQYLLPWSSSLWSAHLLFLRHICSSHCRYLLTVPCYLTVYSPQFLQCGMNMLTLCRCVHGIPYIRTALSESGALGGHRSHHTRPIRPIIPGAPYFSLTVNRRRWLLHHARYALTLSINYNVPYLSIINM